MGGGAHGLPLHRRLHDAAPRGGLDPPPGAPRGASWLVLVVGAGGSWTCVFYRYVASMQRTGRQPSAVHHSPDPPTPTTPTTNSWPASSPAATCGSPGRRAPASSRSTSSTPTGALTRATGSGSPPPPSSTRCAEKAPLGNRTGRDGLMLCFFFAVGGGVSDDRRRRRLLCVDGSSLCVLSMYPRRHHT